MARAVLKVALVVSICVLPFACQQAYLIPDEDEAEESTRGTDEVSDTTNVDINIEVEGWESTDSITFNFGGEPEGGAE